MIRTLLIRRMSLKKSILCASKNIIKKQIENLNKIDKATERRLVVICPRGGRMESHCLMFNNMFDEDKIMVVFVYLYTVDSIRRSLMFTYKLLTLKARIMALKPEKNHNSSYYPTITEI